MRTRKTILIADSNRRLGDLMGQLLDDDPRFRVLGVVDTPAAAMHAAKVGSPDVVLVSEVLDGAKGWEVCAELRARAPKAALLLWTHDVDAAAATPEADALLARGMTYEELAQAVRLARPSDGAPRRVLDLTTSDELRQDAGRGRS